MFLDALFIISFLTSILKGIDFFISPVQQNWMQKQVDSFTLWLSYRNPLAWCNKIIKNKSTQVLATILFGSFIFSFFANAKDVPEILDYLWSFSLLIFSIIILIYLVILLVRKKEVKLYVWLFSKQSIVSFLLKFLSITAIIYLYVFTVGEGFNQIEYLKTDKLFSQFSPYVIHAFLTPIALIVYALISFPSILILLSFLILFIIWIMVKISEFIMWKIALHSKGATIAIATLITILLGILEAYLKTNKS